MYVDNKKHPIYKWRLGQFICATMFTSVLSTAQTNLIAIA